MSLQLYGLWMTHFQPQKLPATLCFGQGRATRTNTMAVAGLCKMTAGQAPRSLVMAAVDFSLDMAIRMLRYDVAMKRQRSSYTLSTQWPWLQGVDSS